MSRTLSVVLVMASMVMSGWSQFLPSLQADSPEEFDDYLTVEAAADPRAVLTAAAAFRDRWPGSSMFPRVYEMEFLAWRQVGDFERARQAGQTALTAAPGNLTVKADLAVMLAAVDAVQAERMARETLAELHSFRVPRRILPAAWARISGSVLLNAHMALGIVLFGRGDSAAALTELELANRFAPVPDPALCLRLGRLYAAMGRSDDARRQLRRAIETGDPVAGSLAKQDLQRLK